MTYDEALAQFFDTPELSVIGAIDALTAGGVDRQEAFLVVIDLCSKGMLGQKAAADLSRNIALYGVTAAAMIREILDTLKDQSVSDRISTSLDASFRSLIAELQCNDPALDGQL